MMMMSLLPLAVVSTLCLSAVLSDPQLDDHWNLWKGWHAKEYRVVRLGMRTTNNLSVILTNIDSFGCLCFCVKEGGGLEEDGLGEEPDEN